MKTTTIVTCFLLSLLFTVACNDNKILTAPQAPGIDESKNNNPAACPTWSNNYRGVKSGQIRTIQTSKNNRASQLILTDSQIKYAIDGKPHYMVGNNTQSYAAYCGSSTDSSFPSQNAIVIFTYQNGQPLQTINYIPTGTQSAAIQYNVIVTNANTPIDDEELDPPGYVTPQTAPSPTPAPSDSPTDLPN